MSTAAAEVFDDLGAISQYVDILASRGVDWGLIGPREKDRLWERHILNSVAISSLIPSGSTLVDLGSGAGLPGVPLSLLRPDLAVTLVEPLLRRATFLTTIVTELQLGARVEVIRARADEVERRFDVVTARALAPLSRLVTWAEPLMRPEGLILAIKGRSAAAELATAEPQLKQRRLTGSVLTVRASASSEPTSVIRVASA